MSVFRVNRTRDYTTISNHHLKNKSLSLKAKGLLTVMLSLPEDWNYSIGGLVAISLESETAIKSTLNELKKSGYLRVTKLPPSVTESGRFEYVYDVFESPEDGKQAVEKQGVENLPLENLTVENHPVYKYTQQSSTNNKSTKESNTNNRAEAPSWMNDPDLSKRMISAISDWLEYKKERREPYKPTGLKSLITQIKNQVRQYGEAPVIEVMISSMGNNYKGICFDKLRNNRTRQQESGNPFLEMLREEEARNEPSRDFEDYVDV